MASLKAKKVVASLLKKGFVKDECHHHYFEFWHMGNLVARTYTSHNNEDINDFLISTMRKQCLMEKEFFLEFVKCTKTLQDYIQLLSDNNQI